MLLFIVFGTLLCANVIDGQKGTRRQVDLGFFEGSVKIGQLSKKYVPLTQFDKTVTQRLRKLIFSRIIQLYYPYRVKECSPFNYTDSVTSGSVIASDIEVKGYKNVKFAEFEVRYNKNLVPKVNPFRLNFVATMPSIVVTGQFNGKYVVDKAEQDFSGNGTITLKAVKATIELQVAPKDVNGQRLYQVTALHGEGTIKNLLTRLTIIPFSEIENDVDVLKEYTNAIKQALLQFLARQAMKDANELLKMFPVKMIDLLIGSVS